MKKVVAAIQARMNSKRLPGKPLMRIVDKTMLDHIIERLKKSQRIDFVCVATTKSSTDDVLVNYLAANNIPFTRGDENDIVGRFYQAADEFEATTLVRVWGDCPLVDPFVIDQMIDEYNESQADFVTNSNPCSYPFGLNAEIYNAELLKKMNEKVKDPFLREFPVEFIKDNSNIKMINVSTEEDSSHIQLTVDYPQDIDVIEQMIKDFSVDNTMIKLTDMIDYYQSHKKLFEKTKKLKRNVEYKEELKLRNKSQVAQ